MCPIEPSYLLSCMILWLCFYLVEDGDCCQWSVYETGGCVQRAHRITTTLVHSKICIMFLICRCRLKRELWHFLVHSTQVDGGTYMIHSSYVPSSERKNMSCFFTEPVYSVTLIHFIFTGCFFYVLLFHLLPYNIRFFKKQLLYNWSVPISFKINITIIQFWYL